MVNQKFITPEIHHRLSVPNAHQLSEAQLVTKQPSVSLPISMGPPKPHDDPVEPNKLLWTFRPVKEAQTAAVKPQHLEPHGEATPPVEPKQSAPQIWATTRQSAAPPAQTAEMQPAATTRKPSAEQLRLNGEALTAEQFKIDFEFAAAARAQAAAVKQAMAEFATQMAELRAQSTQMVQDILDEQAQYQERQCALERARLAEDAAKANEAMKAEWTHKIAQGPQKLKLKCEQRHRKEPRQTICLLVHRPQAHKVQGGPRAERKKTTNSLRQKQSILT